MNGHNFYVANQHTTISRFYSPSGEFSGSTKFEKHDVYPGLAPYDQLFVNPYISDPNDHDVLYIASKIGDKENQ
ncbi:MAG: hypothetical protein U5K00_01185 [Melioribacteraceae bacterium]|nr:hypothetical protein [Melioribacteraceae bacterium]